MPLRPLIRFLPPTCLLLLCLAGVSACSSSTAPADGPENHTIRKGGAAHAPGLNSPLTQCVSCHGADLKGGSAGQPSCFQCHGQKW